MEYNRDTSFNIQADSSAGPSVGSTFGITKDLTGSIYFTESSTQALVTLYLNEMFTLSLSVDNDGKVSSSFGIGIGDYFIVGLSFGTTPSISFNLALSEKISLSYQLDRQGESSCNVSLSLP